MKMLGRCRLLIGGLMALGWLNAPASAQERLSPSSGTVEPASFRRNWGHREPYCPPTIVAPPTVIIPVDPKDPKKIDDKKDPSIPPAPVTDAVTQLSPSGGFSGQGIAPNMFGDRFGTSGFVILSSPTSVIIPNPGAGGVVGRTKVADESSPIPRDRLIFTYDYFDNVPLRAGGQAVNRYAFGFEKTFCNGMASVEVRLPFASTLGSDQSVTTGPQTRTELGNLFLAFKALLYRTDTCAVAVGTGVNLPTADDASVSAANAELLRIENRTVVFEPYFAVLLTPSDRCFGQFWVSAPFDTNGNPVYVNTGGGLFGPTRVGTLQDQTRLFADAQLGYWLIRNDDCSSRLRGLAPFVELHYATTMNDADVIQSGAFAVGSLANRTDGLNLTAGVIVQLGDRCNLSTGVVVPLRNNDNQEFDYQIGVRAQYLFGRTAREPLSYRATGF